MYAPASNSFAPAGRERGVSIVGRYQIDSIVIIVTGVGVGFAGYQPAQQFGAIHPGATSLAGRQEWIYSGLVNHTPNDNISITQ